MVKLHAFFKEGFESVTQSMRQIIQTTLLLINCSVFECHQVNYESYIHFFLYFVVKVIKLNIFYGGGGGGGGLVQNCNCLNDLMLLTLLKKNIFHAFHVSLPFGYAS